jgi:L-methionine (R)-S-oxide reductase
MKYQRNYKAMAKKAMQKSSGLMTREQKMEVLTNILWDGIKDQGLAWVGFYKITENKDEMTLVCRQPKPACSPIGLHGVCGKAWRNKRTLIVGDVRTLGNEHIVCDPANMSEIAIPLFEHNGQCLYILDLDSRDLDSFTFDDAHDIEAVLKSGGL